MSDNTINNTEMSEVEKVLHGLLVYLQDKKQATLSQIISDNFDLLVETEYEEVSKMLQGFVQAGICSVENNVYTFIARK